jgi:hypothetical protein
MQSNIICRMVSEKNMKWKKKCKKSFSPLQPIPNQLSHPPLKFHALLVKNTAILLYNNVHYNTHNPFRNLTSSVSKLQRQCIKFEIFHFLRNPASMSEI